MKKKRRGKKKGRKWGELKISMTGVN